MLPLPPEQITGLEGVIATVNAGTKNTRTVSLEVPLLQPVVVPLTI